MLKPARIAKTATFALLAAVVTLVPAMRAGEKDLDEKRLATLAESAESEGDFRELGQIYEQRAEMLDEKAARHDRLEQRYSNAPKSLIAKRGYGWNTPRRQRDMAAAARKEAAEARRMAQVHLAKADSASTNVD